jgi:hypothetical protein
VPLGDIPAHAAGERVCIADRAAHPELSRLRTDFSA